jgi:hypothetical protein
MPADLGETNRHQTDKVKNILVPSKVVTPLRFKLR